MDPEVRHSVRALLHCGQRHIVLDLTRVSDIDAAGIGELVRAYNLARGANGTVQVVNPTRWVREMIERAGLDGFLLADPVPLSLAD
jgi:anti-anti-sigma factor